MGSWSMHSASEVHPLMAHNHLTPAPGVLVHSFGLGRHQAHKCCTNRQNTHIRNIFLKKSLLFGMCVLMCVHVCCGVCTTMHVKRLGDNLWKTLLSFNQVGSAGQTRFWQQVLLPTFPSFQPHFAYFFGSWEPGTLLTLSTTSSFKL